MMFIKRTLLFECNVDVLFSASGALHTLARCHINLNTAAAAYEHKHLPRLCEEFY